MEPGVAIDRTRRWISTMVIGLNLCPFAQRVFKAELIRYVVSEARDTNRLLAELTQEMTALVSTPIEVVETTLLIHPCVLGNFLDFNDFLGVAERRLSDLGLDGVLQIASFHPAYQFADARPEAVENFTNRSPFPMLHLLREASISGVASDPAELREIPRRNIDTLRSLGRRKIDELMGQNEKRAGEATQ